MMCYIQYATVNRHPHKYIKQLQLHANCLVTQEEFFLLFQRGQLLR